MTRSQKQRVTCYFSFSGAGHAEKAEKGRRHGLLKGKYEREKKRIIDGAFLGVGVEGGRVGGGGGQYSTPEVRRDRRKSQGAAKSCSPRCADEPTKFPTKKKDCYSSGERKKQNQKSKLGCRWRVIQARPPGWKGVGRTKVNTMLREGRGGGMVGRKGGM